MPPHAVASTAVVACNPGPVAPPPPPVTVGLLQEIPVNETNLGRTSSTLIRLEEGCLTKSLDDQQQPQEQPQRCRRVSFSENKTIHEVPHYTDYTDEERSDIWMTMLDAIRIRQDNLSAYFRGGDIRGIESYVPHVARDRKETIEFARTVVMKHQGPDVDLDYLSLLYSSSSMQSKDSAYSRGLQDERDASDE